MKNFLAELFQAMDFEDYVGVITIIGVIVAGWWGASYGPNKAGQQRIAEARLKWGDRYRVLSIEAYTLFAELERLKRMKRYPLKQRRLRTEVKAKVVELMLMINPDSGTDAAAAEKIMEKDCLDRLSDLGTDLDMDFIRKHRAVLKHAWRQAKAEF